MHPKSINNPKNTIPMTDKEIIELLVAQNNKLMTIIEKFAEKDIIVNSTVNSYNNASAEAQQDNSKRTEKNNSMQNFGPDPIIKQE